MPAGPFTPDQVRAELAAGRATGQTPACPVGGTAWAPVVDTPGLGPPSIASTPASESGLPPADAVTPAPAAGSPEGDSSAERVGVAVGIGIIVVVAVALIVGLGYGVYGLYEWVRPYTPTEVCTRLAQAESADEAKRFATPRMTAVIDAIFADDSEADPDDTFEVLQETDGPTPTVKFVGFRGSFFDPVVGQRIKMEGQFRLVLSSGWKVDDITIRTYDGAALPQPVSLVDAQQKSTNQFALSKPLTTPPIQGKGPWGILTSIWNYYGIVGIIMLVVIVGIIGAISEGRKKSKGSG